MTKLPKGLEKMRDELSPKSAFYEGVTDQQWIKGFDTATLEILARAQKLAEALKRIENVNFCDADMDSDERVRIAVDALAEWNEFVESGK